MQCLEAQPFHTTALIKNIVSFDAWLSTSYYETGQFWNGKGKNLERLQQRSMNC
jgi:hypothetical protein